MRPPLLSKNNSASPPARATFVCDGGALPTACGGPAAQAVTRRFTADLSRRAVLGGAAALLAPFIGLRPAKALSERPPAPGRPVLFLNLRLFDGLGDSVRQGVGVLVRGNKIAGLPSASENVEGAEVIDCGGRLAMPGLIDAHWHAMLCGIRYAEALTADVPYLHLVAASEAERTLMRGFTTVRDAGGPTFALKRAIDSGIINGPRIFPSGAMVSQTSGHGDFRQRYEIPRGSQTPLSHAETAGLGVIADGEAEVLRRVREQLLLGATQVKMMAGGGVSSHYDPIDVTQYSESELRAGVGAAEDWGTYVMTHVYTPRGIQRAIRAGVKSIEHGQLTDEESVRMMAGEGVWWSLQPFFADEDSNPKVDPASRAKAEIVSQGTAKAYELSKRFKVKTAWGTDILFAPQNLPFHARHLAKLTPRFYEPLELLRIATARNGELLRLSGQRYPYDGDLGVIAPGAMADLLIVDGDPTKSLDFLVAPDETVRVVMKDGRIYKNTLG